MNTVPESMLNLESPAAGDVPGTPALPALTVFDRCDGPDCTAQAYVRAQLGSGLQLVFCAHHGHQLTPALVAKGAVIRDDSHVLAGNRLGTTT